MVLILCAFQRAFDQPATSIGHGAEPGSRCGYEMNLLDWDKLKLGEYNIFDSDRHRQAVERLVKTFWGGAKGKKVEA